MSLLLLWKKCCFSSCLGKTQWKRGLQGLRSLWCCVSFSLETDDIENSTLCVWKDWMRRCGSLPLHSVLYILKSLPRYSNRKSFQCMWKWSRGVLSLPSLVSFHAKWGFEPRSPAAVHCYHPGSLYSSCVLNCNLALIVAFLCPSLPDTL